MSTPDIPPRDVLRMLNNLGITKVSAPELKQFISDLKVLISRDFELSQSLIQQTILSSRNAQTPLTEMPNTETPNDEMPYTNASNDQMPYNEMAYREVPYGDMLYTDMSYDFTNNPIIPRIQNRNKNNYNMANQFQSRGMQSRSQSSGFHLPNIPVRHFRKIKSSKNFIKVPIGEVKKKSDPVALYHHYTVLWEKYKSRLPGENNWDDLRWSVRGKLLGEKPKMTNTKKTSNFTEEELARRRDGWIS